MARTPAGPRYRADRDAWVCKVDGSLVTFARGERNEAAARKAFRRFMVERDERLARGDRGPAAPKEGPPLGLVFARFLADVKGRCARGEMASRTHADYVGRLADFPKRHGDMPAEELAPHHVAAWLDSKGDAWGANRRGDAITVILTAMRWAKRQKLIEANPLGDGIPKPRRKLRRDRIPTRDEVSRFLGAIALPEFRPFAEFCGLTGCRPGEAARIEARHLDRERGVVRLPEHKTDKKTYRPRIIPLTDAALALAEEAARAHPVGPIFRNTRGNPWERSAWRRHVKAAREAAKLDPAIVLYSFRHCWFTEGLKATGDLAGMAAAGGHADPSTTARVYGYVHEDHSHLRSLAGRAAGPGPRPAPPPTPGAAPAEAGEPGPPTPSAEASPGPAPDRRRPGTPAARTRGRRPGPGSAPPA
jgi:integrase